MDRFLETGSGSLTQATKLLARKAMAAPAASCDDSMISPSQDNLRDVCACPRRIPTSGYRRFPEPACGQVCRGGHREFMFAMTWEESQEKTVVNKQITDQEFPAEENIMKKVYQPYRSGWTVQIKPKPLPGSGESRHAWV